MRATNLLKNTSNNLFRHSKKTFLGGLSVKISKLTNYYSNLIEERARLSINYRCYWKHRLCLSFQSGQRRITWQGPASDNQSR